MDALDKNLFEDSFLSEKAKSYLSESAKWARFLSILGFVLLVILLVVALSAGTLISKLGVQDGQTSGMDVGQIGTVLTVVYSIFAVIYFFPTYYLFLFSTKMLKALHSTDSDLLTTAFKNLKSMFKFWGIFSIIFVGFYGFALMIALIGILAKY